MGIPNHSSQFHQTKRLFSRTLLNFTLWMAIAAFSFQLVTDIDIEAVRWVSEAFGMNIQDSVLIGLRWFAITGFGVVFIVSFFMVIYLVVSWLVINFIGLVRSMSRKSGKNDKTTKSK